MTEEPAVKTPVGPPPHGIADVFTGAPLDVVKLVAAVLMVMDHVNVIFLEHDANSGGSLVASRSRCSVLRSHAIYGAAQACPNMSGCCCCLARFLSRSTPRHWAPMTATYFSPLRSEPPSLRSCGRRPVAAACRPRRGRCCGLQPMAPGAAGARFRSRGNVVSRRCFPGDGRPAIPCCLARAVAGGSELAPSRSAAVRADACRALRGSRQHGGRAVGHRVSTASAPASRYALHVFYPGHLLVLMAIHQLT